LQKEASRPSNRACFSPFEMRRVHVTASFVLLVPWVLPLVVAGGVLCMVWYICAVCRMVRCMYSNLIGYTRYTIHRTNYWSCSLQTPYR
jgi:hypothetical protein